uniref:Uncharacterized protein n=1 Tax=Aegilops tauschii subsp. strangulata TaxID=200361 RepID=A0A453CWL4_AEGTS
GATLPAITAHQGEKTPPPPTTHPPLLPPPTSRSLSGPRGWTRRVAAGAAAAAAGSPQCWAPGASESSADALCILQPFFYQPSLFWSDGWGWARR